MMKYTEKQQEIEAVRLALHDLVTAKKGDLSDPEVTKLSAHLDELIVAYEKEKILFKR